MKIEYSLKKHRVFIYRMIFLGLGVLFFGLTALTLARDPHRTLDLFINQTEFKASVIRLLIGFNALSWLFALHLRPEQEMTRFLIHEAEKELKVYRRHRRLYREFQETLHMESTLLKKQINAARKEMEFLAHFTRFDERVSELSGQLELLSNRAENPLHSGILDGFLTQ